MRGLTGAGIRGGNRAGLRGAEAGVEGRGVGAEEAGIEDRESGKIGVRN